MRLRTLPDPDFLPALDERHALRKPAAGLAAWPVHRPRILLLHGSLRARSYSRFAVEEAARLARFFGAEPRIFDPSDLPLPDQIKGDGVFRVRGLAPEDYAVRIPGMTDDVYIKQVKFGDRDITRKKLDLTAASSGLLEIALSPNGAEITGMVRNGDGDAVADATVQLTRTDSDELIPTVSADQNGAFHVRGLAPGDYRMFAWRDDGDGIIEDPEFRRRFEGSSAKITLAEKAHESVDVRLITKEAMDAEAAKIP